MFAFEGGRSEEDPFNSLINPDCLHHCVTSFYDKESEEEEQILYPKTSAQEVFYYLQQTVNVVDTPLNELIKQLSEHPVFKDADLQGVRKKIIREKSRLKRERARNRSIVSRETKIASYLPMIEEKEGEYKKQRNRISAQVSRDRKKEKVKALEELNKQLQEECKQQREENERLRFQAQKQYMMPQRSQKQVNLKNPLTRLLIFLGIFFLFTIIKEIFNSNDSTKTIAKIQEATVELLEPKEEGSVQSYVPSDLTLEEIQKTLTEVVEDKGIVSRLVGKVKLKVKSWVSDVRPAAVFQSKRSLLPTVQETIDQ